MPDLDLLLAPLHDASLSPEPRQARLYRLLREAILLGQLPPGSRLPGSRQLAADYRLARNSVLYAYQQLLADGFIAADRGGTRVAALPLPPSKGPAASVGAPPAAAFLSQRARSLPATTTGEALLPFAPGAPDVNAFPWAAWARCLQQAWRGISARHLVSAEPGGQAELRRAVAGFLSARRGVRCTPAQVFIVAGGQVALDACARLLADSGDTVWVENPAYQAARNTMLAAGLRVVDVAVDEQGMAAPAALWQQAPPRLIYLTPSHQYPLGSVLSLERRLDFLNRAEAAASWLIEDDYDSDFHHERSDATPLPAIQGLRPEAPVVYVGTFSKLLFPGLRLAYMVVPAWAVDDFEAAIGKLYRGGQAVEQRALARFIESGQLARHMRRMAPIYRQRQQALVEALRNEFGSDFPILGGQAGLHLVLRLPERMPDRQVVEAAKAQGITVRALSSYCAGAAPLNGLLLGYGIVEQAQIAGLVRRLRLACDACVTSAAP